MAAAMACSSLVMPVMRAPLRALALLVSTRMLMRCWRLAPPPVAALPSSFTVKLNCPRRAAALRSVMPSLGRNSRALICSRLSTWPGATAVSWLLGLRSSTEPRLVSLTSSMLTPAAAAAWVTVKLRRSGSPLVTAACTTPLRAGVALMAAARPAAMLVRVATALVRLMSAACTV